MTTNIKVLSWNVFYASMLGSTNKGDLPNLCRSKMIKGVKGNYLNQCLINVATFIDVDNYEFVALQEAEKWKDIFDNSAKLQRMGGYVQNKERLNELVTFYDKSKFQILAVKAGNIGTKSGRPYQIIFFYNNKDCKYYIFINLHNEHGLDKTKLQNELSKALTNGIENPVDNYEYDKANETDISNIINGKKFIIILAGDTNDHDIGKYWEGFKPFGSSGIEDLKDITISNKLKTPPPLTCCRGETNPIRSAKNQDKLYGDYILVSDNITILKNNYVPADFEYDAKKFPTSDHLPVAIELQSTIICQTPQPTTQQPPTKPPQQPPAQLQIQTKPPAQLQTQTQTQTPAQLQLQTQTQTPAQLQTQTQKQPQTQARPYLKTGTPNPGNDSVLVTLYNSKYYNTRPPHVDFKGKFPKPGTKYFLGPAKIGGIGNMAIMRDLLDSKNNPTGFHITIYHESAGKGPTSSLLQDFNSKSTQVTPPPQTVATTKQLNPAKLLTIQTPPVVQKPVNNANNSFKISKATTLRLIDDPKEPSNESNKGKVIKVGEKLIFPCGQKTTNNLVLVYVFNDPNKFGYINLDEIKDTGLFIYKLKKQLSIILRLQDSKEDPEKNTKLNGLPYKGSTVNKDDELVMACGIPTAKNLVLVQKFDDTNAIGYINLDQVTQSGGAKKRIKKVKASNGQIMYFYNGKRISKEKAKKLTK